MAQRLTFCAPYYNQPLMLCRQIATWCQWAEAGLANRMDVVIVDDGSAKEPYGYRIHKVLEKTGWGAQIPVKCKCFRLPTSDTFRWRLARNVAANAAETDWLFITDIDHTLPVETVKAWTEKSLDPNVAYKPQRRWAQGHMHDNPHPNSYLIHQNVYWGVGGYDEDWMGSRTGGEPQFAAQLKQQYEIKSCPEEIVLWGHGDIPDANKGKDEQKMKEWRGKAQKVSDAKKRGDLPRYNTDSLTGDFELVWSTS